MVFQQRVGIAIPFVLVSLTLSMGDFAPTLVAQEVAVADDITATQGKSGNAGKADAAKTDSAVGAGKSEFDEAVVKRIDAESPEQLAAVSTLLESALAKGLNNENKSFAEKMLASVLVQRSQQLVALMQRVRGRRMLQIRDEALEFLRKATKSDESLVEAYLMIAQLNLLPEGNRDEMAEATSKAIELLEDEPIQQSRAYVLRAVAQEDDEKKMADLNSAIEADSTNIEALQARAGLRMQSDDVDGAMADLEKILAVDPGNQVVAQAAVQQLLDAERVDDAVDFITKKHPAKPSSRCNRKTQFRYCNEPRSHFRVVTFVPLNETLNLPWESPRKSLTRNRRLLCVC